MNELSNYLVETFLLTEAVKEKVVVFGGRFQPFHAGHYKTYKHLCSVFGAKNVYIASSNVQETGKSPLSFKTVCPAPPVIVNVSVLVNVQLRLTTVPGTAFVKSNVIVELTTAAAKKIALSLVKLTT